MITASRFKKFVFFSISMVLAFLWVPQAFSQGTAQSKKRTTIRFEDELIHGEAQKPELFYIMQQRQFNFSKLIKLRENFIPEMKKTAEDIPRGAR